MKLYEEFEMQYRDSEYKFPMDKHDHPARWNGGEDMIKNWENNPFSHPYTAGAYVMWKIFIINKEN